ncbi:hypothetical protein ABFX02_13G093200 [Erythranthe guttata]
MASAAIFSSLRRRRSPSLEAFVAPVDLSYAAVLEASRAISNELASSFSGTNKTAPFFQGKNSRSLIRKIQVVSVLLDGFRDVGFSQFAPSLFLCLKELYLLLYRTKILIDYIKGSSKLWLLLQSQSISGHFHDMNQEISTLLDVFPLLNLSEDVKEQVELLQKQSRNSKFYIDGNEDSLRLKLYYFLNEFENGRIPERNELYAFFVEKLGICNVKSCRVEIEFLEEQIVNHDGDIEPTASVLNGFVALIRYTRFLLFSFEDEEGELGKWKRKPTKKGLITKEIADTFVTIPKDFCCPISLDLMHDPVIISTGQTYDRTSITRWMEDGHSNCPKTGQMLVHTKLVPNRALRNLILQWCTANSIPYDPPENPHHSSESAVSALLSKAAIEATKATSALLVEQLANGTPRAKTVAAREIRWLAKSGKQNRACIAEAGAIPLLKNLLSSPHTFAQENSVTAMLNLSIYDKNKIRIMDVEGCLGAIVGVLRNGHTTEGKENAAATLFSLSAVHDYKRRIAQENGAIEALAALLREGTPRGKKDAVTALFNLSTHDENCARMIDSGAIQALIGALGCEVVFEEAAGALALIARQSIGAEAVGKEEMAVAGLTEVMRCGTPRAKENAVVALLELCRSGGAAATEKVVKAPALANLLHGLLFTGTKRARRKAASLARVVQRCEHASFHFGGLDVGPRDMNFPISVPVL